MLLLPENTSLGKLEILEVYEFYDTPVLFTCKNAAGNIFLAVLEDDDTDEFSMWLYVNMSRTRFEHVRSGAIDLFTAFSLPEDGIIFVVRIGRESGVGGVDVVSASLFHPDRLPSPGEFLHLETTTLPPPKDNIFEKAEQARREFLNVILDFSDRTRTEAPAKALGEILRSLQNVVDSLAQRISVLHRETKRIPKSLRPQTELVVVGVAAGSFEVELASSESVDMFNYSLVGEALQELVNLLNTSADADTLKNRLSNFETNVSSNYLTLLETLSESTIDDTRLIWASPNGNRGTAHITSPTVFQAIDFLKAWEERSARVIEVTGKLIGENIRKKDFEIETREKRYFGSISDSIGVEVFDAISNATLSQYYTALLREITTVKIATGDVSVTHELLELKPASMTSTNQEDS